MKNGSGIRSFVALAFAALAACADPVAAETVRAPSGDPGAGVVERAHGGYVVFGHHRDWTSIGFGAPRENGTPGVCAIYSRPKRTTTFEGSSVVPGLRGEMAAFMTWGEDGVQERNAVVSFLLGAAVRPISNVHSITIDEKTTFPLYGEGDRLYAFAEDDREVAEAMRRGREVVLRAELASGRSTEEAYSLMGVQAATRQAMKSCN